MAGAGFFRLLSPIPQQIADVHRKFAEIRTALERLAAVGSTVGLDAALGTLGARVDAAYLEFTDSLTQLAVTIAEQSKQMALSKFDRSVVRPQTDHTPHLRDLITAVPVTTSLPTGAVGIGDVDELNKSPYWKAQEFGLSEGFVGRTLTGYFMAAGGVGGGVAPDPSQFRVHPLFQPVSGGMAPHMTIGNPIEAKHFLTDTSRDMYAAWLKQYDSIERRAVTKLATVGGVIQTMIRDLAAAP